MADFFGFPPINNEEFNNFLPNIDFSERSKLKINSVPVPSNGKAAKAGIEQFTPGLYLETAKIDTFKMRPENVLRWVELFAVRYHYQFGNNESYDCDWQNVEEENKNSDLIDEIKIQVNSLLDDKKLFTIKVYLSTHTVSIQGNYYDLWCEKEFPWMKQFVNNQSDTENVFQNEMNDTTIMNVQFDTQNEHDETEVMKPVKPEGKKNETDTVENIASSALNTNVSENKKGKTAGIKDILSTDKTETIQDFTSTITTLHTSLQKLEEQYCQFMNIESDITALRSDNTDIKQQIDTMKTWSKSEIEELRAENKTMAKRVETLEATIKTKHTTNDTHIEELYKQLTLKDQHYQELFQKFCQQQESIERKSTLVDELKFTITNLQSKITHQMSYCETIERENERLKQELSHQQETQHVSKLNAEEEEHFTIQVPTTNSFSVLQDLNDEKNGEESVNGKVARKGEESVKTNNDIKRKDLSKPTDETKQETRQHDSKTSRQNEHRKVLILSDSHGNYLDEQRLYKYNRAKVVVLSTGKKNILGARDYITNHAKDIDSNTELVLIVGSNDLDKNTPEKAIEDLQKLIETCRHMIPGMKINLMPTFVRLDQEKFNKKSAVFNSKLSTLQDQNVSIITNEEITGCNCCRYLFARDGVHFSPHGTMALVKILKTHLNPRLGLPAYSSYDTQIDNGYTHQPRPYQSQTSNRQRRQQMQPSYNRQTRNFDLKSALSHILENI